MICSTIIPTIGRDTLRRAVESALSQDLPATEHEIIVVNDSGGPLELSAWLHEKGINVLDTNRCRLNFACNAGAALASGKYLKFLHDDDYLLPGGLMALIEAAENSGAAWVVGGTQIVDDDGQLLRTVDAPGLSGNVYGVLAAGSVVHIGDCLISRQAFMAVGGFDPQMAISEDRDLELRLSLGGRVASTSQLVACIRVAGSQGSTYDFADHAVYYRLIRERAFDAPGAFQRLRDSVAKSPYLRGRVCRNYLFSAVLNLKAGKLWLVGSRLTCGVRLAGWHIVQRSFWKGAFRPRTRHQLKAHQ